MSTILNVLLIKDESWSAQCLEHDICGQGETITQAVHALSEMLAAESCIQEANDGSLADIPPAPEEYWRLFASTAVGLQPIPAPVLRLQSDEIPAPFMIPHFQELRVA